MTINELESLFALAARQRRQLRLLLLGLAWLVVSCRPLPPEDLPIARPAATVAPSGPAAVAVMPSPTPIERPTIIYRLGDPTATRPGIAITDPDFIAGKSAYESEAYTEVIQLMGAVMSREPQLAPPYWYRGMAYYQIGEYHAALTDLEVALLIDPAFALAYADRGLLQWTLGEEKEARADWGRALALDASLAKVHHYLAAMHAAKGDLPQAVIEYTLALAIDPHRADTWFNLAQAYFDLGDHVACVNSADQVFRYGVVNSLIYYTRGTCLANLEEYKAALLDLNDYLALAPDDPKGWYNRGLAQHYLGEDAHAVVDFGRAIALDPNLSGAMISRGDAYRSLGQYETALADYAQALSLGEIPRAYFGQGEVYRELEQYETAIEAYRQAALLSPDHQTFGHLAELYLLDGDYANALLAAEQALQLEPGEFKALILQYRGRAHLGLRDCQRAEEDLVQSVALYPSPISRYFRGVVYAKCGRPAEAIRDLEHFVSSASPDNPAALADAEARLAELKE